MLELTGCDRRRRLEEEEASAIGEDEGVTGGGRCCQRRWLANLWPPLWRWCLRLCHRTPCLATLEMVPHALVDRVGDGGGGWPRRQWRRTSADDVRDGGRWTVVAHGCGISLKP